MKKRNGLFSIFGISLLTAVLLAGCSGLADPLKKAVISFDEAKIRCTLASDTSAKVRSGTPVAENTALLFSAEPSDGKMIAAWKLNGKQKATTENFLYYVNPKELKIKAGETITVTYEEAPVKPVTLNRAENVVAFRGVSVFNSTTKKYEWKKGSVLVGTEVKAGDVLFFEPKLTDKKVVDQWFINDIAYSSDGTINAYPVSLEKAENKEDGKKVLSVRFTEKSGTVAIKYDENLIWANVKSGAEVNVGTSLRFSATLGRGKVVSHWKINDVVQYDSGKKTPQEMSTFEYIVDARDAKGDTKTIEIGLAQRDAGKVKITYKDTEVYCSSPSGYVASGTEVEDGIELTLKPVKGEAKAWYADTTKVAGSSYTVNINAPEALDGVVDISCELAATVTITVDSEKVLYAYPADKKWEVDNRVPLTAKVSSDDVFEGWYKDGVKLTDSDYNGRRSINYRITQDDAKKGAINLTWKVYPKLKFTFEADKVTVRQDSTEITSETELTEGSSVSVSVKELGKVIKEAKLNGIVMSGWTGKRYFEFRILNSEAKNGVIDLRVELKDEETPKKITLEFANNIECKKTDDNDPVLTGAELPTDSAGILAERLTFTVTGDDAGKRVVWFVNGVQKKESSGGTWSTSTYGWDNNAIRLSDTDGGTGRAKITYRLK